MNRHLCLSETGQENESKLSDRHLLVGRFRVFRVGLGRVLVLVFGVGSGSGRIGGVGLGWAQGSVQGCFKLGSGWV